MRSFKKGRQEKMIDSKLYKELIGKITTNDEARKEMSLCIDNTEEYYTLHEEDYDNRGMDDTCDQDELCWIGIVDILQKYEELFEFDYNCYLDELLYGLSDIKGMPELDESSFDEDENITEWFRAINEEILSAQGKVLLAIDIESDCYPIILVDLKAVDSIEETARQLNHRIISAQNL